MSKRGPSFFDAWKRARPLCIFVVVYKDAGFSISLILNIYCKQRLIEWLLFLSFPRISHCAKRVTEMQIVLVFFSSLSVLLFVYLYAHACMHACSNDRPTDRPTPGTPRTVGCFVLFRDRNSISEGSGEASTSIKVVGRESLFSHLTMTKTHFLQHG